MESLGQKLHGRYRKWQHAGAGVWGPCRQVAEHGLTCEEVPRTTQTCALRLEAWRMGTVLMA